MNQSLSMNRCRETAGIAPFSRAFALLGDRIEYLRLWLADQMYRGYVATGAFFTRFAASYHALQFHPRIDAAAKDFV